MFAVGGFDGKSFLRTIEYLNVNKLDAGWSLFHKQSDFNVEWTKKWTKNKIQKKSDLTDFYKMCLVPRKHFLPSFLISSIFLLCEIFNRCKTKFLSSHWLRNVFDVFLRDYSIAWSIFFMNCIFFMEVRLKCEILRQFVKKLFEFFYNILNNAPQFFFVLFNLLFCFCLLKRK